MVFNATFNNISVISWLSVLLLEETRVHGEKHWPAASHWQICAIRYFILIINITIFKIKLFFSSSSLLYHDQVFNIFQVYQYFTIISPFFLNLKNVHGYLLQHSLKLGGTKDHFNWEKVPDAAPYWKDCITMPKVF